MKVSFYKPSREILLELINNSSTHELKLDDVVFGVVAPITVDGADKNTAIEIAAYPDSSTLKGQKELEYDRLDLGRIFDGGLNLKVPEGVTTIEQLLPIINAEYGMALTTDDIVGGDLPDPLTITAKNTGYVYIGSVEIVSFQNLADLIKVTQLDGLAYPPNPDDMGITPPFVQVDVDSPNPWENNAPHCVVATNTEVSPNFAVEKLDYRYVPETLYEGDLNGKFTINEDPDNPDRPVGGLWVLCFGNPDNPDASFADYDIEFVFTSQNGKVGKWKLGEDAFGNRIFLSQTEGLENMAINLVGTSGFSGTFTLSSYSLLAEGVDPRVGEHSAMMIWTRHGVVTLPVKIGVSLVVDMPLPPEE